MQTVGVVTPCFNAEKFIAENILSVSKSITLDKFKIEQIVVDDGSKDDSVKVLKNTKDLKVICNEINKGQSAARNEGIKALVGADYLYFLDADDLLFQNSLRYLWETATSQKKDWVYGDFVKSDAKGRYLAGSDYYGWNFPDANTLLYSIFSGEHYFQQNSLFKASVIREVGGFDENLKMAEDLDLAIRLVLKGLSPVYLPGPLYMHRCHSGNISAKVTKNPDLHLESLRILYRKYENELKKIFTQDQIKSLTFLRISSGVTLDLIKKSLAS
jgi:glycosyltransferase involved in cell wall biosynthesis